MTQNDWGFLKQRKVLGQVEYKCCNTGALDYPIIPHHVLGALIQKIVF